MTRLGRFLSLVALSCLAPHNAAPQPQPPPAAEVEPAAPMRTPRIAAPKPPVPIAEYFKIRRVDGASFSFDESLVAYLSDEGGRMDVWVQPVSGGTARQLTRVKGFVHSFAFSPTADMMIFEADDQGDELARTYRTDSSGKEPVALFPDDPRDSRTEFLRWADDGESFLYLSSRRDPKYLDLYEYVLATGQSTLVWQSSGSLSLWLASRDHRRFLVREGRSDADSEMYLVERGSRGHTHLTPHQGDVLYWPTSFSRDGETIYFLSDADGEFTALYAMDLASRKTRPVLKEPWDVETGEFSDGWTYFFTHTNADGAPRVVISDTRTGKPVALAGTGAPGPLVPVRFSRSDRYLAAVLQTDVAPVTLWLIDLEQRKARALVDPLPEALRGRRFVVGESVRVVSFDGREVPAFLYRPEGAGPHPGLLDIHGGPTAQSPRRWKAFVQYLLTKGYAVLVPNVRGSTGYGKTWTRLDNRDLGGGPLKDVIACKQWLVRSARVDPNRVAIMGASYGGYMTLAAATFTPTEFAAHVDIFGVSDLKTLMESFPPYWAVFETFLYQKFGNPADPADARYQRDRSPLHFIDRVQRPLLVVQGTHDARVRKDQSDRVVEALRKRGVPVDYLVIEGEGHGFSKTEHLQSTLETADRFLDRHLFGDTEVKGIR